MTVYFFCPDYARPSGGVRAIYTQVKRLVEQGVDARLVHTTPNFEVTWHGISVPIVYAKPALTLNRRDVLVVPEGLTAVMRALTHAPSTKIVNALSWAYILMALKDGERWQDHGFAQAITPNQYVKDYVEWCMQIPCTHLPVDIDLQRYRAQPSPKTALSVAYLSRKSDCGAKLERIARDHSGVLSRTHWYPIDDMTEQAYAQTLGLAQIYLATGTGEGLNVSVLEAMASGCLVIGYTGGGGREYMRGEGEAQNCILVPEGDYFALGVALEQALQALEQDPDCFAPILNNANTVANRYGQPGREAQALVNYFAPLMNPPKPPSA
jgi:hypothetical protein